MNYRNGGNIYFILNYIAGGCKHQVAFLLWLHRRSEEPSVTSKECYWKKSSLSSVGHAKMDLLSLLGKDVPHLEAKSYNYVRDVVSSFPSATGGLFDNEREVSTKNPAYLSIYQLFLKFQQTAGAVITADDFLKYMVANITDDVCVQAEKCTRNQRKNSLWYELKFARVTASRIYEACRCKTTSGSLVESIMGASGTLTTEPITRGQNLESLVLDQVENIKKIKIKKAGLFLNKKFPIFGASPDGITDIYCVEVKCPTKEKTSLLYVNDGVVQKKFLYQLQLQMFLANRAKGLFCVASPNFEVDKQVSIYEVELNRNLCDEIINQASVFWKTCIFKKLCDI